MSRLVDGLVDQGLMDRRTCDDDRRHVRLSVTPTGQAALREARELAKPALATAVGRLTPDQQAALVATSRVLRDVFAPEAASADGSSARPGGP